MDKEGFQLVRVSVELEDYETTSVQYRIGTYDRYHDAVLAMAYEDMGLNDVLILYRVYAPGKKKELIRRVR